MMKKILLGLTAMASCAFANSALAVDFKSPSGNIVCLGDSQGVYCQIFETNKGLSCEISLAGHGRVTNMNCDSYLGNWIRNANPRVLAYGKTIKGNGWSCTSQKSGMTCKSSIGRGFSLSRASQRTF